MLKLNDPSLFEHRILIGGPWLETTARIPVDDPATGEIIGSVADCGAAETRQAIAAAEDAFHTWRFRPAGERAALLERWYDLMFKSLEDPPVSRPPSRASRRATTSPTARAAHPRPGRRG